MEKNHPVRKRPKAVWLITGYYLFFAAYALLMFIYLIPAGKVPLSEAQKIYFDNLTSVDYFLIITTLIIYISGSISLFLLRKVAYPLFLGALALKFLGTALLVSKKDYLNSWLAAVGASGYVNALIIWGILIAVCIYTKRLINRGVLV